MTTVLSDNTFKTVVNIFNKIDIENCTVIIYNVVLYFICLLCHFINFILLNWSLPNMLTNNKQATFGQVLAIFT